MTRLSLVCYDLLAVDPPLRFSRCFLRRSPRPPQITRRLGPIQASRGSPELLSQTTRRPSNHQGIPATLPRTSNHSQLLFKLPVSEHSDTLLPTTVGLAYQQAVSHRVDAIADVGQVDAPGADGRVDE